MARVVILGGGFAGLAAARELQRRRGREAVDCTLVDRHNFMLFTPMLPEAASGVVDPASITQPFRAQLRDVAFELGEVLSVEEQERLVRVRHPLTHETRSLPYDELILALGSAPSSKNIPGVERFSYPLKTISDAERLRNAAIGAIEVASRSTDIAERDRLLRFVIVGGGFTGVEMAGELSAFLRSIVPFYPSVDEHMLRVVLVQAEDRLLPHLPSRFGKHAARVLAGRGIDIRIGKEIDRVDPGGVTLKGGERFDSRVVVWSAGNEPAPFVKRLGLKLSGHGAIVTARDCSVPEHPHLWAIGDCAAIPKESGGTYAPLAQNAMREGPLAARNVLARLRGRKTKTFSYRELGQMASLGDRHAMAELPGKRMLTGLPAWVLWRTYYLGRLPGLRHRTRVALDWAVGAAFGPALARLPLTEKGETSFDELHAPSR